MKTGVFFNKVLVGQDWPIIGNKWTHFPEVMEDILKYENVILYESQPVSEDLLSKVHSQRIVNELKNSWYYEGAVVTIGGMVSALEKIWSGEINNALNFMVAAGHHAGPDSAWGGTYASITGPAIYNLRQKFPEAKKFAIIDTDSHCGDGTRAMFLGDKNVFHVCFCSSDEIEDDGTKICVDVGWRTTDKSYLEKVTNNFIIRVKEFKPDLIIHILGHDTCVGDYGDRGVSRDFFLKLVQLLNQTAMEICDGRLAITTMGGDSVEVADYIFPNIIRILSGHD
ncbi:MAG: hypothetical protein ACTSO9_10255 [Candidatus Helarchaeota archaeon]